MIQEHCEQFKSFLSAFFFIEGPLTVWFEFDELILYKFYIVIDRRKRVHL